MCLVAGSALRAQTAAVPRMVNPITGVIARQGGGYVPLTGKERWQMFVRSNLGPGSGMRAIFTGLGDHADDAPREWGQGFGPAMQRIGSRYGRFALRSAMEQGGTAILGHDPRYIASADRGFVKRLRHAFLMNFITLDKNGRRTINYSALTAAYASEYIAAKWWMPPSINATRQSYQGGNQQLALGGVFNLVKEFWPEISRPFHRKSP